VFALIESCPEQSEGGRWTGRVLSFAIHAALVTAALAATRSATAGDDLPLVVQRTVIWNAPAPGAPRPPCDCGAAPPPVPIAIPDRIPDPPAPTDVPFVAPPAAAPGLAPGSEPGVVPGFSPAPGVPLALPSSPLEARVVDEPPVMLAHPEPRYPGILQQAGIDGHVVLEAVVDTLGRVEPGSLRIISSAHALFAEEARQVLLGSRFRPGRMAGRAVRVRVQVPVAFAIRR